MFVEDVTYAAEQLKKLIGGTITDTVMTPDSESYGFVVEKDGNATVCWVDCDPEGNGAGWISMEKQKKSAAADG